jgi:hypothetical protein
MESVVSSNDELAVAASAAPEDLRCGDYVAVLSVIHEYPSFLWCCDAGLSARDEPVRVERRDTETGAALKIKAICLPLVFVKDALGKHRTLDVRLCRLARLSAKYARKVWKAARKNGSQ